MLSSVSGRNRTMFKLNDGRNQVAVEITSIAGPQTHLISSILAGVNHIFYVVPLCSYCAILDGRNQMKVLLDLFSRMSRLDSLRTTQITIFFTQADIFPQWLVDVPVESTFSDCLWGNNARTAYQYFVDQFLVRDHRSHRQLHIVAPGLDGTKLLQDTLDKLHYLVLQNVRSKQRKRKNPEEYDRGQNVEGLIEIAL